MRQLYAYVANESTLNVRASPVWSCCYKDLIPDAGHHLWLRLRTDVIKAMSRGFSWGKQVINFSNTRNSSRVYYSWQQKMNNSLWILKTIMENYGWKWPLLLFWTSSDRTWVDVLTASNNYVNFVETRATHFVSLLKINGRFVLWEWTRSTTTSCIGQFYLLFAPWNTTWHYFYPVNPKARAKMVGIVNNVYWAK